MTKMFWVCIKCGFEEEISVERWNQLRGKVFKADCPKCKSPMRLEARGEEDEK